MISTRTRARLLALATAAALGAATSAAQGSAERHDERADSRALGWSDRELLHPESDPVQLIGLDEADPNFRARTLGLANCEHQPVAVDVEEARNRRLAAYANGPRTSTPLPIASDAPSDPSPAPDEAGRGAKRAADGGGSTRRGRSWLALLFGVFAALWLVAKRFWRG